MKLGIISPHRKPSARLKGRAAGRGRATYQNKPCIAPSASTFANAVLLVSFGGTPERRPAQLIEAAIFAGLGVRPGVADLVLSLRRPGVGPRTKIRARPPTAAQIQFISEFRAAGGEASIASGLDQALYTLETWGATARARSMSKPTKRSLASIEQHKELIA